MHFSVALLFHISQIGKPDSNPLWEERIILVVADDEDEARIKADGLIKKEFSYENAYGETVLYKFWCIERVFSISGDLSDGTEVFVRFLRDSEAMSILTPFED